MTERKRERERDRRERQTDRQTDKEREGERCMQATVTYELKDLGLKVPEKAPLCTFNGVFFAAA